MKTNQKKSEHERKKIEKQETLYPLGPKVNHSPRLTLPFILPVLGSKTPSIVVIVAPSPQTKHYKNICLNVLRKAFEKVSKYVFLTFPQFFLKNVVGLLRLWLRDWG